MVFNGLFSKAREALVPEFGGILVGVAVAVGACLVLVGTTQNLRASETTEWRQYEQIAQLQRFQRDLHRLDTTVSAHLLGTDPLAYGSYQRDTKSLLASQSAIKRLTASSDEKWRAALMGQELHQLLTHTNTYMTADFANGGSTTYLADKPVRALLNSVDGNADTLAQNDDVLLDNDRIQVSRMFTRVESAFLLTILAGGILFVMVTFRLKKETRRRLLADVERGVVRHRLATAHDLLESLSRKSALSSVLDREGFESFLAREYQRAAKSKEPLSLSIFNIDNAAMIRLSLGDKAADLMFAGLAKMLLGVLRKGDVVGHFGSDRLAVLLPGLGEERGAAVTERLRQVIAEADWNGMKVTLTAGVAEANWQLGESDLMTRASKSLLAARISHQTALAQSA